jgi:hypothetical protein
MSSLLFQRNRLVVEVKRSKLGKPRGETCRWTPELDGVLKSAWTKGGHLAARRAVHAFQPKWSRYSIKRRAVALGLRRPKARRWTAQEDFDLEAMIEGNASLKLIASRLGRTVPAVRKHLWDLGHKAESLGGYKVKDLAETLKVPPARVQYWVAEGFLLTKGGRITESSFSKFLQGHSTRVHFEMLTHDTQNWLVEMGYPAEGSCEKGQSTAT